MLSAVSKSDESLATEETKYKTVLDAILEVAISLDMLGYKYDTCIGISKTLVDDNN